MRLRAGFGWGLRAAAAAAAMCAVLTGATCNNGGNGPVTTRPGPPGRKWPGTTGQVNRLIVMLRGSGRAGFAIVVNTMEISVGRGSRFVTEDGSYTFRLYPNSPAGKPVIEQLMGEWTFNETEVRERWSPGGWGGVATFTFLLRWQGPPPPTGASLVLISEFTPHGREARVGHSGLPFTIQVTPG